MKENKNLEKQQDMGGSESLIRRTRLGHLPGSRAGPGPLTP